MDALEHEIIDPAQHSGRDIYRLMTDLVAPRPIAWVSTLDERGRGNLAPFSYFQAVCSKPPTIVVSMAYKGDGTPKDSLRNILARREFTISHVSRPLAEAMNRSSADYPDTVSEWDHIGPPDGCSPIASTAAHWVAPPRVAAARASFECRMVQAIPLGRGRTGGPSSTLVIAEVLCFTVAQGFLATNESGHFDPMDPARLAAVGRMGGIAYTETTQTFELARPKAPQPRST